MMRAVAVSVRVRRSILRLDPRTAASAPHGLIIPAVSVVIGPTPPPPPHIRIRRRCCGVSSSLHFSGYEDDTVIRATHSHHHIPPLQTPPYQSHPSLLRPTPSLSLSVHFSSTTTSTTTEYSSSLSSASAAAATAGPTTQAGVDTDTDTDTDTTVTDTSPARIKTNPKLASIIRGGLPLLHQWGWKIQDPALTHQPFVHHHGVSVVSSSHDAYERRSSNSSNPLAAHDDDDDDDNNIDPEDDNDNNSVVVDIEQQQQLRERRRLLEIANECLDLLCRRRTRHRGLTLGGEPLSLVDMHVHKGAQSAILYWSLPLRLLLDHPPPHPPPHPPQPQYKKLLALQQFVDQQMHTRGSPQQQALAVWTGLFAGRLRRSCQRTPRITWRPATVEMMCAVIHEHTSLLSSDEG